MRAETTEETAARLLAQIASLAPPWLADAAEARACPAVSAGAPPGDSCGSGGGPVACGRCAAPLADMDPGAVGAGRGRGLCAACASDCRGNLRSGEARRALVPAVRYGGGETGCCTDGVSAIGWDYDRQVWTIEIEGECAASGLRYCPWCGKRLPGGGE